MAGNTVLRLTGFVLVAAAALAVAAWAASSVASASLPCGQWPVAQPRGTAPTPLAAPTPPGLRPIAPVVVPVGTWSNCFRPAVVTIQAGETVQWQQADAGQYPIVLDSGTQLGTIRHALEVRFNRPGTYHFHLDQSRDVTGTIIVVGTTRAGPAFEISEFPPTRG